MPGKKDNRGYALVTFRTNDLALKAIEKLNNATFKVCFPLIFKVNYHGLMSMNVNLFLHLTFMDFDMVHYKLK